MTGDTDTSGESWPKWADYPGYLRAVERARQGDSKYVCQWLSQVLNRYSMILTAAADQLSAAQRECLQGAARAPDTE